MKKYLFFLITGVAVLGISCLESALGEEPLEETFHCTLALQGAPKARAALRLNPHEGSLSYALEVDRVKDITMAHLHLGKTGGISTPVAWLYPDSPPPKLVPGQFHGMLAEGVITAKDLVGPLRNKPLSALMDRIHAGEVYLNIHTKEHPAGGICGPVELTGATRRQPGKESHTGY
jgi:hypothetical protein